MAVMPCGTRYGALRGAVVKALVPGVSGRPGAVSGGVWRRCALVDGGGRRGVRFAVRRADLRAMAGDAACGFGLFVGGRQAIAGGAFVGRL